MNFSGILMISFGIAMDAFAVSITIGTILKERFRLNNIVKIGVFLTFFQAIMPLVGWSFGSRFNVYIKNFDHWVAFFLLGIIGAKMVFDSIKNEEKDSQINPLNNKVLIYLSLATSIDALAVGISFAFLNVSILFSIICIGFTTFVLSVIGMFIGKFSGERLKKKAGLIGGFVLMLIGIKILLEHLGILFK